MAYDFKNDPNFTEDKKGMYSARWRATLWGLATSAIVLGGYAGVALTLVSLPVLAATIGIAALGSAIFTGYKAYTAQIDERVGLADITAQRSAARIVEAMEKSQSPAQSKEQTASADWQKLLAAQAMAPKDLGRAS